MAAEAGTRYFPRMKLFLLAAASLILGAAPSFAQTTVVSGCNELLAGEVGVRELAAAVGDSVDVAVTIRTVGTIEAFGLDLVFPAAILSFVGLTPGDLTSDFTNISALEDDGVVTVGGFTLEEAIPSGAAGRLAYLRFVVTAPGTGSFVTHSYVDDLQAYHSCESVHGPSSVERDSWAAIKAGFQAPAPRSR